MDYTTLINIKVNVKIPNWEPKQMLLENISVSSTWKDVLGENGISNSRSYGLKGRYPAKASEMIFEYCQKFKSQRALYTISVVPKSNAVPRRQNTKQGKKGKKSKKGDRSLRHQNNVRYVFDSENTNTIPIPDAQEVADVFKFRDEDTQLGNERANEEQKRVVANIRRYFHGRVSNIDIIHVRNELLQLKREEKFLSLSRLLNFTAGFMESVFLRDV